MPGTTDFLPFATGSGANVESQATYAADPTTGTGFASGVAQSAKLNKVWRQSAFIAATIATFVAGTLGINVPDNGNLTASVSNFVAALQALNRIKLVANAAFYVSPSGSDSTGSGSSGNPWATRSYAAGVLHDQYDLGGYTATINVADGTYTDAVSVTAPFTGAGQVIFNGDTAAPLNCLVNTSGTAFSATGGAQFTVQGFAIAAGNYGFYTSRGGVVTQSLNAFGTCVSAHMRADSGGHIISPSGASYSIVGPAPAHLSVYNGHMFMPSLTVTITNTPAFSIAFASAAAAGDILIPGFASSGGATGKAYSVVTNGVIDTQGGGLTVSGTTAGTTATGGQFV